MGVRMSRVGRTSRPCSGDKKDINPPDTAVAVRALVRVLEGCGGAPRSGEWRGSKGGRRL